MSGEVEVAAGRECRVMKGNQPGGERQAERRSQDHLAIQQAESRDAPPYVCRGLPPPTPSARASGADRAASAGAFAHARSAVSMVSR
jgi:hypothetical protein